MTLFQRVRNPSTLFIRFLAYPSGSFQDEAIKGRIRAEQINAVKRYLATILMANVCNAAVLVAALWASSERLAAILWASTVLALCFYYGVRHHFSGRELPSYVSFRAISRASRNALALGALWAALPLLFFAHASAGGQVIIACLCAGMLGGGTFALANIPAAAFAFTAPIVAASAIAIGRSGDTAYALVAVLMVSYIAVLWRGIYVYAARVAERVAEQMATEQRVRRDELTGLPNRVAFFEALEAAIKRQAIQDEQFAILFLDLNDFKAVNDRFGHVAGDKLLAQVGQRLQGCVKQTDLVARLSGDEFAVILAGPRDSVAAATVAGEIASAVERPFKIDGTEILTGTCVGIAIAPIDGSNPEQLLKSADEALYEAKHSSLGVIQLYDRRRKATSRQQRVLERDLRHALHNNEFTLAFQPIFDLNRSRVTACETLLRWNHPTLGPRPPNDFIEAAERTGLINEIGPWVFQQACVVAATWPKDIRLAINVSAIQLRQAGILSSIVDALSSINFGAK